MTWGTVLVLPAEDAARADLHAAFLAADFDPLAIEPVAGPAAAIAARLCAAITAADPVGPLHVVAFGSAARLLPSIALAQRAAHRAVAEYVLVEAVIPVVTDAWPDARVSIFTRDAQDPSAQQGRLRGWDVRPLKDLGQWEPTGR